jgi:hypothetical protein
MEDISRPHTTISNLFKDASINFSFHTTHTISKLLKPYTQHRGPEYDKSGIHKLSYAICNLSYVGNCLELKTMIVWAYKIYKTK